MWGLPSSSALQPLASGEESKGGSHVFRGHPYLSVPSMPTLIPVMRNWVKVELTGSFCLSVAY